jgi:hypothetical protein
VNNPLTTLRLKRYKEQDFRYQNLEIEFSNNQLRKDWILKSIEHAYLSEQIKSITELFTAVQKADSTLIRRVDLGLNSNTDRLSINLLKGKLMLQVQQLNSQLINVESALKNLNPSYYEFPNSSILFDINLISNYDLSSDRQLIISTQEQKVISLISNLEYQKSFRLPRIQIGLTQQSFQGFQTINNQEVFFNNQKPFHSVQVGLSAPILMTGLSKIEKSVRHQIESENYKLKSAKLASELKLEEINLQLNLSTETLNSYVPGLKKLLLETKESVSLKIEQQNLDPVEIARIIEQQADLNWSINEAYFTYQINRINQKINQ